MKILHIVHKPRMSGAEVLVKGLTKVHRLSGEQSRVVSLSPCSEEFEGIIEEQMAQGVTWNSPSRELGALERISFLRRDVADFKPDVIFAHTVIPAAYARISMLKNVIVVLHAEDNYVQRLWAVLEYGLQFRASSVICVSNIAIEKYCRKYKNVDVEYIPNGIELNPPLGWQAINSLRSNLGIENKDSKIIIQVGRVCEIKRQHLSVFALKQLVDEGVEAILLIVGICEDVVYEDYLKKLVSEMQLNDNVRFLGARNDVNNLLQASDVFVMPSRHEAQGIALLEALGAGLPIVASKISGFAFSKKYSGVDLVDVEDIGVFVRSVKKFLQEEDRYHGRDMKKYSLQETADKYLVVAKKLVAY